MATLGQFPPDGGVGLRLVADFTFYPAEGTTNELCFPKGAEIREAEDINGDWLWGVYCGVKDYFRGIMCITFDDMNTPVMFRCDEKLGLIFA